MFEKIENKWTEDSGDYDDMIQKQLSNKRTVSYWTCLLYTSPSPRD